MRERTRFLRGLVSFIELSKNLLNLIDHLEKKVNPNLVYFF